MSVAELKERHMAATETVNSLTERLKRKRLSLLDTDGLILMISFVFFRSFCFYVVEVARSDAFRGEFAVAGYAKSQGKSPVTFGPTDLVCCRTLQGHTGKVRVTFSSGLSLLFA